MLATLSFICAVLLAVFVPVQRVRTSVPKLSIILWLFGYNLVHGINALVWAGNVDIHIPVWCDIVTNFMLGANLALPAAFLCLSQQLELLSSMRTISSHPIRVRNHLIFEIVMCYLLPILYILLHLVVQDHRFDLVENLGCSASVDPSAVGISLMWIPPLLLCTIGLIFSALAIGNSLRHSSGQFALHLESRSANASFFFRSLFISKLTTVAIGLVYIFCSFFGPPIHPWSWTAVHASMFEVDIVSSQDEVGLIQLAWWGIFGITIFYLFLSFCLGEETRDIFKWIRKQVTRERPVVLPIHISKTSHFSFFKMTRPSLKTRPLTFQFKSGWDDMLDVKVPKFKKNTGKPSSTITFSARSTPTPTISTVITEDEIFMASTLSYLDSPTAKTLGLSGSPVSRSAFEIPPEPRTPLPLPPVTHKEAGFV